MKCLRAEKVWIFLVGILIILNVCAAPVQAARAAKRDKADLNKDLVVDQQDLTLFSARYLQLEWSEVDWCQLHDLTLRGEPVFGESSEPYLKHFSSLLTFIYEHFSRGAEPGPPPLALKNQPQFLARLAAGSEYIYVTDPKVGSVFVYDLNWELIGELKDLDRPPGVAVDTQGNQLVRANDKYRPGSMYA